MDRDTLRQGLDHIAGIPDFKNLIVRWPITITFSIRIRRG